MFESSPSLTEYAFLSESKMLPRDVMAHTRVLLGINWYDLIHWVSIR